LQEFVSQFQHDAVVDVPTDASLTTPTPHPQHYDIEYRHVWFTYPSSTDVLLRDIRLSIPFPSSVLIVGSIGSGKSSLVKMLLRLLSPTKGDILLGGRPLTDWSLADVKRHVAYMNQSIVLFNRTIRENIFYGKDPPPRAIQDELLRQLPIPQKIMHHMDTLVDKKGHNLSGGEKQMILLLRMYFKPHPVLLLDEPTANLDPVSAKTYVVSILKLLREKKTIVCITHDMLMAPFFDNVYHLEGGRLSKKST